MSDPTQRYADHKRGYEHLNAVFGADRFGLIAERLARFFGTPRFILTQTFIVGVWIAINAAAVSLRWDPYPFILLNLAFSTQAAYAAPLILLAQTRQADRDRAQEEASAIHRDELAANQTRLLEQNTALTEQVVALSREIDELTRSIHARVVNEKADS